MALENIQGTEDNTYSAPTDATKLTSNFEALLFELLKTLQSKIS